MTGEDKNFRRLNWVFFFWNIAYGLFAVLYFIKISACH